jgi:hypothetical protein
LAWNNQWLALHNLGTYDEAIKLMTKQLKLTRSI